MAVGYYVSAEEYDPGFNIYSGLGGGFHSHELQPKLLPFLKAGNISVEPVGGTKFHDQALHEFRTNLVQGLVYFAEQPLNLDFVGELLEHYYKVGKLYGFDLLPPRGQALAELSGVLGMAEIAIKRGETLFFVGD